LFSGNLCHRSRLGHFFFDNSRSFCYFSRSFYSRWSCFCSRSWFSPEEQRQLEGLPHSQRRRAFFHAWARKEAYIKAIGLGLAMPLDRFTVSVRPHQAALLSVRGRTPRGWHLQRLPVGPSHAAALATAGRPTRIAVQELR